MELHLPRVIDRDHKTGRFLKGRTSFNKGKKFPGSTIGGSTKFKKGGISHNHKDIGTIVIRRNYKRGTSERLIKVGHKNWVLLNRYVWEQYYGEIPAGHVIRFKNEKDNFDIDNLECIPMRENMLKNQNKQKAVVTMRKTWRLEKMRERYGLRRQTKLRIK